VSRADRSGSRRPNAVPQPQTTLPGSAPAR
jgi:hypothetical protein